MSIVLSTGNVSHARKGDLQDVICLLKQRVQLWRQDEQARSPSFGPNASLEIPANPKEPLFCNGRTEVKGNLEVTVKLFFPPTENTSLISARVTILERALTHLVANLPEKASIDHLVLSFPEISFADDVDEEVDELLDDTPVEQHILDIWAVAASLMESFRVKSLGVSEFSTSRLESLLAFCKARDLPPPSINQINIRDCCVLPPSLVALAKDNGIKLLAHNDPLNIIPDTAVQDFVALIKGEPLQENERNWSWGWVTKTTSIVASRSIVCGLGWSLGLVNRIQL